jgi:uncharacterized protein (DUF302 family)
MIEAPLTDEAAVITVRSALSLAETHDRLRLALDRRGMTIYADVDRGREASGRGLPLPQSHLVMAGNAAAELPLIARHLKLGAEFPIRFFIYEDELGRVWFSYSNPAYLGRHRGFEESAAALAALANACAGIACEATL